MFLKAYAVGDNPQPLVPATAKRDWMDAFTHRHPYRCLPLAVANAYGWHVLLPADVVVRWNGKNRLSDIEISCDRPYQVVSNFKRGIVTFDISYIFQTPPGYHLLVTGPANTFKDGVAPMTAVIESDWLPYTFTFNYQLTRPGEFRWRRDEPYAQIAVVQAGLQETVQPSILNLSDNPQLAADHEAWVERRSSLRARQEAGDREAWKEAWGKDYFLGRYADGRPAEAPHTNKLCLKAAIDERGGPVVDRNRV
jgi:Family of unknown function (DUF6065)